MTAMPLDATNIRILNQLQQDASLTNVDLAARIHLSPSPCLSRVKFLEKTGVIERRVALLNPQVLGLGINAFVRVRLSRHSTDVLERFSSAINDMDEVMELYLMSDFDYVLRVMMHDIDELEQFVTAHLSRIEGVTQVKTDIVLRKQRHKTALPIQRSRATLSMVPDAYPRAAY
ncbi:Lrp/AsnC family transcriptional regulator [Pararhodobacter marinus]|uniref:Lrp/AsnC family transcriptional regulator n=1 Tax=Pararhodobacter marinus TaxID=2184063 RepID=UPI003512FC36